MLVLMTWLAQRLEVGRLVASALAARDAVMDDQRRVLMTAFAAPAGAPQDERHRLSRCAVASRNAGPLPAMLKAASALDERPASGFRTDSHGGSDDDAASNHPIAGWTPPISRAQARRSARSL
jgi:hypothetical protein